MSRTYHHGFKWAHKVRARCRHLLFEGKNYRYKDGSFVTVETYTGFWPMSEPSSWHNQYSTRPRRAKERMNYGLLRKGGDPDGMVWPHDKKPHYYYW